MEQKACLWKGKKWAIQLVLPLKRQIHSFCGCKQEFLPHVDKGTDEALSGQL